MSQNFVSVFRQSEAPAARGKYLSRVFGIFSEEIVRLWASDPRAHYEDLGRPTLRKVGEKAGSTLDFTLRSRVSGKIYVAELKCEIEYQDFRYMVLTESRQLDHHNKPAFSALLAAAAQPSGQQTFLKTKAIQIDGAILVWGAATPLGKTAVMMEKSFFDVLTIAEMISDLLSWKNEPFKNLMEQRRVWSSEMFDGLIRTPDATNA